MKDWMLHPGKFRLAREGGWLVVGQISSLVASLYAVRILTGYLEPSQYGDLALGLTIASLFNQIIFGGIGNGIARFFAIAREREKLSEYFFACYRLAIGAGMLVTVGGLVILLIIYYLNYMQWFLFSLIVIIYSFANGISSIISSIQNAARQRLNVVLFNNMDSWMRLIFAMGFMFLLGHSSVEVIIGYALSSILTLYMQFYSLKKHFGLLFRSELDASKWSKDILTYSKPFMIWGIFTWIQLSSDRWALQFFSDSAQVGLYIPLYQIGYAPISLGMGVVMSFIAPIFYDRTGDGSDNKRKQYVKNISSIMLICSVTLLAVGFFLALIFHHDIYNLFVATKFQSTSYLLPWMVLGGGLFGCGQLIGIRIMAEMRVKQMTTVKISTAILGCIFNAAGAYFYGIQGVTISILAHSTIYFLWMLFIAYEINLKKYIS